MAYALKSSVLSLTFVVAFVALVFPYSSQATTFAVVDMAALYKDFKEVSKSQAFLKEKKDEYQHVIDKEKYSLKEEELALENLKEDLRQNKDKYSPDELAKKESEQRRLVQAWQKKFQAMKTKFEQYKQKLEELEKTEFQNIRTKVDRAIGAVAGRLRVDFVIEKQWLYYGNAIDISDQVLKELEGTR